MVAATSAFTQDLRLRAPAQPTASEINARLISPISSVRSRLVIGVSSRSSATLKMCAAEAFEPVGNFSLHNEDGKCKGCQPDPDG